ncbi:hypothetical protein BGZ76_004893 [Entomortierella beljakovae]|nr:hypothetical protein BGZ76_004893 [Entomortierella beljakovae]
MVIVTLLSIGLYAYWAVSLDDESGQVRKNMKARLSSMLESSRLAKFSGLSFSENEGQEAEEKDIKLRKLVAMIMATTGGLIASQTLLLAKSGIKLVTSTLAGHNQFKDMLSFFILFVLVFTAILQVYCLNTALKLYDSVMVVPMFYGYYTAFGLINSTIYLNQLHTYPPWALLLILIGIAVLIFGVRMLSAPKPDVKTTTYNSTNGTDYSEDEACERKGFEGQNSNGFSSESLGKSVNQASQDRNGEYMNIRSSPLVDVNLTENGLRPGATGSMDNTNTIQLSGSEQFTGHTRRGSLPQTVLRAVGLSDRRSSVDRSRSKEISDRRRGSLLIDTSFVTRGRSETRRVPSASKQALAEPRPMSPSEFRAQYTNSPFPLKPKHLQDGAPGLGSRSSSPVPIPEGDNGGQGRSPIWAIGNSQIFEDMNLFKLMRRSSVDLTSSLGVPPSPNQAFNSTHTRRDSWTGLPSNWDEPNRKAKHSMLFGENGRSSSIGSRSSSRSSSPTPSVYSHSRRQSTQDTESSQLESHSYLNNFIIGVPPPTSATPGAENVSSSSVNISVTGSSNALATSTGTFGAFAPSAPASASASGPCGLPLSVQQQLQQLQQHQHYPTSQLQHSITTSSISTIGSLMPSISSTSIAQLAMEGDLEDQYAAGNFGLPSISNKPPNSSSPTTMWMRMTPSQSMQAIELDMEELDKEFLERESAEMRQGV